LLDREHYDGRSGRDNQQEFAKRLSVDRDGLADTDDSERDEQQDAAERGLGNMAQKRGAECQQCENDGRRSLPEGPQPRQGHRRDQEDAGRAADVTALRILGPGFEPAVVDAIDILRS
jgi:hypothetical protein